jgi:hypothetical protein
MPTKQEIEEFRKAALLYSVACEKLLLSIGKTLYRDELEEAEYLRLQSEAVTTARVTGQNDVIPSMLAMHEPIKKAWLAYSNMVKGCGEDSTEIGFEEQAVFLESLRECVVEYFVASEHLDLVAGLRSPIETRVFSEFHYTENIRKMLGKQNEPMPDSTWQLKRKQLGNQIQNHPKSGTKRVQLTRYAAEFLALDLPEFRQKSQ